MFADRSLCRSRTFNTVSMPTKVTYSRGGREVSARLAIWQLGGGVLFTARSSGIRLSRDEALVRRSGPANLVVSVQTSGRASFRQAGRYQAVGRAA